MQVASARSEQMGAIIGHLGFHFDMFLWLSTNCKIQVNGGITIIWHNEVRDLTVSLPTEVCHDVCVEPRLQTLLPDTPTEKELRTHRCPWP